MKKIKFKDLIVYEDDHYMAINKPAGIASLNERDQTKKTLIELAKEYDEKLQLCHRLDKETSGLMAVAKNSEAYRHLAIQFEKREVDKVYHAVVNGVHKFEETMIDEPLAVSARGNVWIDGERGKISMTVINTLKTFTRQTLVECIPLTGRMHQIRVHLASVEAPITADLLYGGDFVYLSQLKGKKFNLKQNTEELPLISRVALHAYSLSFKNLEGKTIELKAEYHKDMRALVNQLERHS